MEGFLLNWRHDRNRLLSRASKRRSWDGDMARWLVGTDSIAVRVLSVRATFFSLGAMNRYDIGDISLTVGRIFLSERRNRPKTQKECQLQFSFQGSYRDTFHKLIQNDQFAQHSFYVFRYEPI